MNHYIEYSDPPDSPRPERLKRYEFWVEWRIALEVFRLGLASRNLRRLPSGDMAPVMLIPGWKAPEASMGPLRLFLKSHGYNAQHWGLGTNHGDPEGDSERLAVRVTELARYACQPVALIGWSLGGVVARETARLVLQDVSVVITYGTPVVGGPTYTLAAASWGRKECERIAKRIQELDEQSPISVPIVAIFTRKDKVVSWPACIDRVSPKVKHFEVESTHISMGLDPAVWSVVMHQLAVFSNNSIDVSNY